MKWQKVGLYFVYFLLAMGGALAVGRFVIQYPAGTDVFAVDENGDTNITGTLNVSGTWIAEGGTLLSELYLDSSEDNTSIFNQLAAQDECSEITNCVDNAWDSLTDMVLNDGQIYIGDGSNDPVANAVSGHATITNAGVVSVIDTSGLSAKNITNLIGNATCGAGDAVQNISVDESGVTTVCVSAGGVDSYVDTTGDTMTGDLVMNSADINLTNEAVIKGEGGATNATIDSTGNFIIVLG